jgi:hypothetical protein
MLDLLSGFTVKGAVLLFVAMFAVVAHGLLTGQIRLRGLLVDDDGHGHSIARVQMLVLTLYGAMQYLALVVKEPGRLPEPPGELLTMVGGSHVLFMGSKVFPLFISILSERMQKK